MPLYPSPHQSSNPFLVFAPKKKEGMYLPTESWYPIRSDPAISTKLLLKPRNGCVPFLPPTSTPIIVYLPLNLRLCLWFWSRSRSRFRHEEKI